MDTQVRACADAAKAVHRDAAVRAQPLGAAHRLQRGQRAGINGL